MNRTLVLKLWRGCWRTTSMRFYCLSMVLAVTAMTSVCLFSNRVSLSLQEQAISAVGGDIQLSSHHPIPPSIKQLAKQHALRTTNTVETQTVLFSGDALQLARLKAVATNYPLKGKLTIRDRAGALLTKANGPKPGALWLDGRLLESLQLAVGDHIDIGNHTFQIEAELVSMPDNGTDLFVMSPVAMIHLADLPATELILPGSRAKYRLMAVGSNSSEFLQQASPLLTENIQIIQPGTNQSRLLRISEQGLLFLRLGALCALLMASVTIGLTTHLHVQHEAQVVAVFRSLGMSLSEVLQTYCFLFLGIATACALAGIALGAGLQSFLVFWLSKVSPIILPSPSAWPFALGLLTAWILVLGLTLPAILRYQTVSTKSLLAEQAPQLPPNTIITLLLGLTAVYTIMALLAQSLAVANLFLLGTAIVLCLMAVVLFVVLVLLVRLGDMFGGSLRLILGQLSKRLSSSLPQLLASSLAVGLFLTLTLVGSRLLSLWDSQIPEDTPNYFAYNINPDQADSVRAYLDSQELVHSEVYPMVRGRIDAINGKSIRELYLGKNRPNSLRRALNLTWAEELPANNKIIAGKWFEPQDYGQRLISIEEGMAHRLGVSIGDKLSFRIADRELTARIISIRTLQWDSFNPNFLVVFPPQVLTPYPSTGIVSFYLPESKHQQSIAFNRLFPTVTLLEVEAILQRIKSVVAQLQKAIGLLQVLTMATTCLVLILIVMATLRERLQEIALLKTFGVSEWQLRRQWLGEMALMGILAGGLASAFALFLEYRLSVHTLGIEYQFNGKLLLIGVLLGLLLHLVVGLWGLKRIVAVSPANLFRAV